MESIVVRYAFSADERNNAIAELAPRHSVESAFSEIRGRGKPTWIVVGVDSDKAAAKLQANAYLADFEEQYSIVMRYKSGQARNVGIDRIVAAQEFIEQIGA